MELALDKSQTEWASALQAKQAAGAHTADRQHISRAALAQLVALHQQRNSVLAAQLGHASQRLAQAASAGTSQQVGSVCACQTSLWPQ